MENASKSLYNIPSRRLRVPTPLPDVGARGEKPERERGAHETDEGEDRHCPGGPQTVEHLLREQGCEKGREDAVVSLSATKGEMSGRTHEIRRR